MAYQANRNNNDNNQADSNKQERQAQNRENTKELAKDAGTAALQGLGVPGPLAGMATNKIANNPLVNKALNKTSDKLHKNPVASKAINGLADNPAKNMATGASNGKSGSASGSKKETNDSSGSSNAKSETGDKGSNKGKSSLGKPSPFSKKSNRDSVDEEEQDKAKTTMESIGNIAATIKKVPPFVWPILGWVLLIFLMIMFIFAIISQFFPMFGVGTSTGTGGPDTEYIVNDPNSPEGKFYAAVDAVKNDYKNEGKDFDAGLISGVFVILNHYDSSFTFEKMTESEIKTIADMMFKEGDITITCEREHLADVTLKGTVGNEPSCPDGYTEIFSKRIVLYTYDEDLFKSNIVNYAEKNLTLKGGQSVEKIAEEVFTYVNNFKSFTERKTTGSMVGNNNSSYWWPIGSAETTSSGGHLFATGDPATVYISSYFGARQHPITGQWQDAHGALDIAGVDENVGNVIAAKDGIVELVITGCVSFGDTDCGGGFGNYIILKHSDGNYTLYAHLHQNSITVSNGDTVRQGQVIAKVGSSGMSTGPHLHFEVRVGENNKDARQDPLDFVDPENPRPTSVVSESFLKWLHGNEGGPTTTQGDQYEVYVAPEGNLTVGHGVLISANKDRFRAFGIDPDTLYAGSAVPINVVDAIEMQIIESNVDNIKSMLSRHSIKLENYQIEALLSRMYSIGNVDSFPEKYKKYGNTDDLCTYYLLTGTTATDGNIYDGLIRRREEECNLFRHGVYPNSE